MRLLLVGTAAVAAAAAPSAALADAGDPAPPSLLPPPLRAPGAAVPGDLVASAPGAAGVPELVLARQVLPASAGSAGLARSRTIYLNRGGITVTPGASDSRTDRSSIVDRPRTLPAWSTSSAVWSATKQCLEGMFARFGVTVTDEDPGPAPHIEAVFGGSPSDLGLASNIGGISPFTASCGVIEGSIVFAFTKVLPANPQRVCEIMAQEIAHSYGLDHELLPADPMSYLSYYGSRAFQDALAPCGEGSPRPCGVTATPCRDGQNSVAVLRERLGPPDATAPDIAITAPADGAVVPPGFTVAATASDDNGVASALLFVDGEPVAAIDGAGPFAFATPAALAPGLHELAVEASDGLRSRRHTIAVTVAPAADGDGLPLVPGCAAAGRDRAGGATGAFAALAALTASRRRRRLARASRPPAARVVSA